MELQVRLHMVLEVAMELLERLLTMEHLVPQPMELLGLHMELLVLLMVLLEQLPMELESELEEAFMGLVQFMEQQELIMEHQALQQLEELPLLPTEQHQLLMVQEEHPLIQQLPMEQVEHH